MNFVDDIKTIEIESTSDCNAACPGCRRTSNSNYNITHITLNDFKRIFPEERFIKNKRFDFFGVLGDHIVNPECYDITKYLIDNGGTVRISTNASYQTRDFWEALGILSENSKRLTVLFSIDGHEKTNHIYRIKTKFSTILRNIQAYTDHGKREVQGEWIFISFDHNIGELEAAYNEAAKYNLTFKIKTATRNVSNNFHKTYEKLDEKIKKIVEPVIYTQSEKYKHPNYDKINGLKELVNDPEYASKFDQSILETIECNLYSHKHIFLSHTQTLWPCCYLWDSFVAKYKQNKPNALANNIFDSYQKDFNCLKTHSIDEVLSHNWFAQHLGDSFNPLHPQHNKRCITTCAYKGSYKPKWHTYKK